MRFPRAALSVALIATVALTSACDDDLTGLVISDFQGTWTATAIQFTAHADPSRTLNLVPLGGGLVLNLDANGNYTGTFSVPGEQPIPITGTVTLVSDTQADIVFNWPAAVTEPPIANFRADFELRGNNLTFTRQSTTFPFPGQPGPEPSSLVIVMRR
jgi:hypothetical protein